MVYNIYMLFLCNKMIMDFYDHKKQKLESLQDGLCTHR